MRCAHLKRGIGAEVPFRPMVRGRCGGDGAAVDTKKFGDARARRLAEREFNLSWAESCQATHRERNVWTPQMPAAEAGMSLEDGIAETSVSRSAIASRSTCRQRVSANVTSRAR